MFQLSVGEPETINMGGEPDTINMGGDPDDPSDAVILGTPARSPRAPRPPGLSNLIPISLTDSFSMDEHNGCK